MMADLSCNQHKAKRQALLVLGGATSASMLNSGNFALFNSDGGIVWQTFDYPTDTILQGQHLSVGKELVSSTGIFRLAMQQDGNLVQYPVGTKDLFWGAYWSSGTNGKGDNVTLCLDDDGLLYLLNSTGTYLSNLTKGGSPKNDAIYLMRLDGDGILRLYSYNLRKNGNWSILWSSTNDMCLPKGLCGLNGYCVINDQQADCNCLPGFAAVKQGNLSSGCERNFAVESCKSKDGSLKYTMEELLCSVMGSAKSNKLPLKYGRRSLDDSNVAFVKVEIVTWHIKGPQIMEMLALVLMLLHNHLLTLISRT
uniref:Bulb-type lectin domain-containing protein n=1 Tax=Fagus sylvatica TaxID=28930 RepID=A0A2N9HWU7_FAGSY